MGTHRVTQSSASFLKLAWSTAWYFLATFSFLEMFLCHATQNQIIIFFRYISSILCMSYCHLKQHIIMTPCHIYSLPRIVPFYALCPSITSGLAFVSDFLLLNEVLFKYLHVNKLGQVQVGLHFVFPHCDTISYVRCQRSEQNSHFNIWLNWQ